MSSRFPQHTHVANLIGHGRGGRDTRAGAQHQRIVTREPPGVLLPDAPRVDRGVAQAVDTDSSPVVAQPQVDTLTAAFEADKAGRYEVVAVFTKAVDYCIAKLAINGKPVREAIDFYNNGVVKTAEISLGIFDLSQGSNTLTVELMGANEKAEPQYMFGLDYLLLKPAK